PDQICRGPFRSGRRRGAGRQGADQHDPRDAEHDRHDLRPQYRVDAAAQPGDAGTPDEPRRRQCRQGVRVPARSFQGGAGRLSRLPGGGGGAAGRYLPPALHRGRIDLLAVPEGRRGGGVPVPRRAQDRQAGGQPRRDRDAGQPPGGDDASVGRGRAQAVAGNHRQSGAHLDRGRGCRRSDRRHGTGAGGDL
ncbi:hypothetical protein LTR94_029875, partial [Friedmanniomyces endolithicus]